MTSHRDKATNQMEENRKTIRNPGMVTTGNSFLLCNEKLGLLINICIITLALHYEKELTKNIRPTDILQTYTSI